MNHRSDLDNGGTILDIDAMDEINWPNEDEYR